MTRARALIQLARADFLERVRRHSFLVTLGITLFSAYMFLPPNHARYSTLHFAGHRGLYNSAWVGCVISMLSSTFLGLAGFYLVKNAVERDRRTGVGQILAATPLSKPLYLAGKLASNFALLATMVAVLAVAAGVMQVVRGEVPEIRPIALVAPFVVLTLPFMAMVAALAVVFEATPVLRRGFGNVVYFFVWMTSFSLTAALSRAGRRAIDPLGGEPVLAQMHAACAAAFPGFPEGRGLSMGFNIKNAGVWDLETFAWSGPTWTPGMLAARLAWVGAAVAVTMLAALWFDRFDAHAAPARPPRARRGRAAAGPAIEAVADARPPGAGAEAWIAPATVHALPSGEALRSALDRRRFMALAVAETRIMLKGVSRWWWLVTIGLVVAALFVPPAGVRGFVAPFALVWPLLLWSPMGTRERQHRTEDLLFSVPRPGSRLLVAQWLAGVIVALAVTSGGLVRFALGGQGSSLAALLVADAFVPSLALAFGTWSGSAKLFEVLYLMLWYMGPMNRIPVLDYVGATQPGGGVRPIATFGLLAATLAALAFLGRLRQQRR